MKQRIDVIVPCYRYGHYLEECVQSVLTQADVDVRVLILDDTSPDNTEEIGRGLAARDSRVTFRRHVVNKGHITTFNEGIDWASGDLLLLLSADDYLLPGALGRAASLMADNPEVGFAFGNVLTLLPDGTRLRVHPLGEGPLPDRQVIAGADFIRMSGATNIVATPTAVVRTSLQKRLGGYKLELPHAGDMEMWLRLAFHGPVGFINDDQAVYRRHAANMSSEYFGDSMLPDLVQKKVALEMLAGRPEDRLDRDPELMKFLNSELAREALKRASIAFNNSDLEAANTIKRFALELSPSARLSSQGIKLAIKQAMGFRNWNAISSILRQSPGGY